MKTYPSIDGARKAPRQPMTAFVKYDGSNLRFEHSKKQGWHKFGTRKLLFDETSNIFGSSIPLFLNKYGEDLERIFRDKKLFPSIDRFIVFCEWFGAKSFAGYHEMDDPKDIVLFDVNPHKKGFLCPKDFLKIFGDLDIAEVVCTGNLNQELINGVRNSEIDVASKYDIRNEMPEGVVCKGGKGHKLWMCKIKTQQYYDELKIRHPVDWEKLWE